MYNDKYYMPSFQILDENASKMPVCDIKMVDSKQSYEIILNGMPQLLRVDKTGTCIGYGKLIYMGDECITISQEGNGVFSIKSQDGTQIAEFKDIKDTEVVDIGKEPSLTNEKHIHIEGKLVDQLHFRVKLSSIGIELIESNLGAYIPVEYVELLHGSIEMKIDKTHYRISRDHEPVKFSLTQMPIKEIEEDKKIEEEKKSETVLLVANPKNAKYRIAKMTDVYIHAIVLADKNNYLEPQFLKIKQSIIDTFQGSGIQSDIIEKCIRIVMKHKQNVDEIFDAVFDALIKFNINKQTGEFNSLIKDFTQYAFKDIENDPLNNQCHYNLIEIIYFTFYSLKLPISNITIKNEVFS